MRHSRPAALVSGFAVAVAAAVLATSTGTAAVAKRLIDSVDVADESLTGQDVRDGTLTAADLDPAITQGGSGGPGPDQVLRWQVNYTSDGGSGQENQARFAVSTDTIPAHTRVEAVDVEVTGDFSACGGYQDLAFTLENAGYRPLFAFTDNSSRTSPEPFSIEQLEDARTEDEAVPVALYGSCGQAPMPDFQATVTFQLTRLDEPVTGAFQ